MELKTKVKLLLDTGAEISLIKASKFCEDADYFDNIKIQLSGLSNENIETLGYAHVNIKTTNSNHKTVFHIVSNKFPLEYDGILGNDIITKLKFNINNECKFIQINNNFIPIEITQRIMQPLNKEIPTEVSNNKVNSNEMNKTLIINPNEIITNETNNN